MSETLGERLPDAIRRLERLVGSGKADRLNRDFAADLMAVLGAAKERQRLQDEVARLRDHRDRLIDLLACYRLGRHPGDRLMDRLHQAREAADATGGEE